MKYNEMSSGMYVIRTAGTFGTSEKSATIFRVEHTSFNIVEVVPTLNCIPNGKTLSLDNSYNDGNWHNVTELILRANSVIAPPARECEFCSATAMHYRNFLGLTKKLKPISPQESVGKICLLGECSDSGILVGNKGYYSIAYDDFGFIIVYGGYCEYVDGDTVRQLELQILNPSMTKRLLYPAKDIVDACCFAYNEDCQRAEHYATQLAEMSITSGAESATARGLSVSRMNLHN